MDHARTLKRGSGRNLVALVIGLALAVAGLPQMVALAELSDEPEATSSRDHRLEDFGTVHEFSDLEVLDATQNWRHMEWGADVALLFQNTAGVGEHISVEFEVPEDSEYTIAVQTLVSAAYGIYDVTVNETDLGELNAYAPQTRLGDYETLGTLTLDEGPQTMHFESTGQDESSAGHFVSFVRLLVLDKDQLADFKEKLRRQISEVRADLDAVVERIPASDVLEDEDLRGLGAGFRHELDSLENQIEKSGADLEAIGDEIGNVSMQVDRFASTVDVRVAQPGSPFGLATADSMDLVYPAELPCEACSTEPAQLALAQGEHENIQSVLVAYGSDITGLEAEISEVSFSGGTVDVPLEVSIDPLGSVFVRNTPVVLPALGARPENYEGWIPDPIRTDLSVVDVPAWTMQPYWIDVFAPARAAPGEYTVTVEFSSASHDTQTLELSVTVWPFEIPDSPDLGMSMTTKSTQPLAEFEYSQRWWMLEQVYEIENEQQAAELRHSYIDFLNEFKIEPDLIYNTEPPPVWELQELDERVGLNQFNVLYLPGYGGSSLEPDVDEILDTVGTAMAEYEEAGLADRAYIYGFDERTDADLAIEVLGAIKEEFPDLPIMSTFLDSSLGVNSGLAGIVDIWVPGVDRFDHDALASAHERGDEVYWYTHQAVRDPLPNWFNGYPPSDTRVLLGPMSHKMDVDGFLYYNIMRWPDREPMTDGVLSDWDPQTYATANGDGSLFYPGADGPLPSQRLQNYRDGMEDFNVLNVLTHAIDSATEAGYSGLDLDHARDVLTADAVVENEREFTKDAGAYREWRDDVAESIEALRPIVTTAELADTLAAYVESGAVDGPIVNRLTNAVEQAQRHLNGQRVPPAVQALERFLSHLDNPNPSDTVIDDARADLGARAREVLDLL